MGGKVVVVSHSTIVIEKLHSDTCKHLMLKVTFGLPSYNPARDLKSLMPKGRKNLGLRKVKI